MSFRLFLPNQSDFLRQWIFRVFSGFRLLANDRWEIFATNNLWRNLSNVSTRCAIVYLRSTSFCKLIKYFTQVRFAVFFFRKTGEILWQMFKNSNALRILRKIPVFQISNSQCTRRVLHCWFFRRIFLTLSVFCHRPYSVVISHIIENSLNVIIFAGNDLIF